MAKAILALDPDLDLTTVEQLKNLNENPILKRRLSQNIHHSISIDWNGDGRWVEKIKQKCEGNGIAVFITSPQNTIINTTINSAKAVATLPYCCQDCDYIASSDINASRRLLQKNLTTL